MRLADALVAVRELTAPPLHLFLGSDAYGMAQAKLAALEAELTAQRALSLSTDFPK